MLMIETTAIVREDGTITLRLPGHVRRGLQAVTLLLRDCDGVRSAAAAGGGAEVEEAVGDEDARGAAYDAVYARR